MSYYTEEERKEEWIFECDHFTFKTCKDLSRGVTVTPRNVNTAILGQELMNMLAQEISRFTFYWLLYHKDKLNGFSGLDTIKWKCQFS